MFVSLTLFSVFFTKLPSGNDLNFVNGFNGKYSAVNGWFLQLTALVVEKLRKKYYLTVVCSINGCNGLPKLQNFHIKFLTVYQIGFTGQAVTKLQKKVFKSYWKRNLKTQNTV